jgi:hypothetical protein
MSTFQRRLAKTIVSPLYAGELEKIVDAEFEFQNHYLCHILRKCMKAWAGDNDVKVVGPKKFGAANFKNVYYDNKVPSLKNTIVLADKLDLTIVMKLYPYASSGAVFGREYTFGAKFEHAEFMAFLDEMPEFRPENRDSREMKEVRAVIFEKLSNPAFPLFWTTLIRYAAACGYQLNCYLNQKPNSDPPSSGCLTPSKNQDNLKQNSDCEGACDKGDYDALLRRLNYPM